MAPQHEVVLITGPAGSGKSTVNWEMEKQLKAAGVAHAAVDLDELDRIFPPPSGDPDKADITYRNLAALWRSYAALGATRMIISSIMVDLSREVAGVLDAIPGAKITIVRLRASDATLVARLNVREVGAGRDAQIARARDQAERILDSDSRDALVLDTDGKSPEALASAVLALLGWLAA